MANDSEADRAQTSMRSLLARIEAEVPPLAPEPRPEGEGRALADGERAVDASVIPGFPSSALRRAEGVAAGSARRVGRAPPPPRADPVPSDRHMMLQLAHARMPPEPEGFAQSLGGWPVIVTMGGVFLAAVVVGVWLVFSPRSDDTAAARPGATQDAIRTVTTRTVNAELVTSVRAPRSPGELTADPAPRLVATPEVRQRRMADATAPPVEEAPAKSVATAIPLVTPNVQPLSGPRVAPVSPRLAVLSPIAVVAGTRSALPVRIEPSAAADSVARVVVRGLPGDVSIPGAQRGPAGSVVVMPQALAGGTLDLTQAKPGSAELEIEIQGSTQDVQDRVIALLTIAPGLPAAPPIVAMPAPAPVAPQAMAPSPPPPAVAALPPATPAPRDAVPNRGDGLLARGRALLTSGDVAGARLVLERAVEMGSPGAALALGETYDPTALAALGARGIPPDVPRARAWYQKAREAGVAEAEDRLRRLPSR
jgi:hypothetical protein